MRVLMLPLLSAFKTEESGIRRVVEAYHKYLAPLGVRFVGTSDECDLIAVHAGTSTLPAHVAHCHGLYWTADYHASGWEWAVNRDVTISLRKAKRISVPSDWVAETIKRDMRRVPTVLHHGIDLEQWGEPEPTDDAYVLWNKNRTGDVCSPQPAISLAEKRPDVRFMLTLTTKTLPNMRVTGVQPHDVMRNLVKRCSVYLATTKETFGIGTLEAMASARPVLGFDCGGARDLVQHGISGYLARPGDLDDLLTGLDYCLTHKHMLGANGREIAQRFTWQAAAERVLKLYESALVDEPPTCAVIIPCFNYAGRVSDAIKSASEQSYKLLTDIVVVDDGSSDGDELRATVRTWQERDARVKLIRQDNAGVAVARNTGIASVSTKYVCCLDADDKMLPDLVETCVKALEQDNALGIAYTKMQYVKRDGNTGISQWPAEWDFDQQLQRRNQVPTCCVFKREMWAALGGYRQRYAPRGAGAEDAELWLRAGAYGYRAALVSDQPSFVYSWQTGRVSGDRTYREPDWLQWHPWAGAKPAATPPFASYATPRFYSHPVRQYDEPVISVIIPVSSGHTSVLIDALDSLDAQTFARWEAIVVDDAGGVVQPMYAASFPHVRFVSTDKIASGAGIARNVGARAARAPLLCFLDADDYLQPEALELMLQAWESEAAIVYSDYIGKAYVEDVNKLSSELRKRVYHHDALTHEAVIGHQALDYDCARAQQQPEDGMPYLWCNVTCLIPKAWHDEIGGFDESMRTWEDVDYHWRMARAGKCYTRIERELLTYRFYTGSRREQGIQDFKAVIEYLRRKYTRSEAMGCGCKGGKAKVSTSTQQQAAMLSKAVAPQEVQNMTDGDLVMIRYTHPNRGEHSVVGSATRTRYGMRSGGDTFLVNRADVAAQPHLYEIVGAPAVTASQIAPQRSAPPPPDAVRDEPAPTMAVSFDMRSISGITDKIAAQLVTAGKTSVSDLKAMTLDEWAALKGVSKARAQQIVDTLSELT